MDEAETKTKKNPDGERSEHNEIRCKEFKIVNNVRSITNTCLLFIVPNHADSI